MSVTIPVFTQRRKGAKSGRAGKIDTNGVAGGFGGRAQATACGMVAVRKHLEGKARSL
jgi:hypothetical protein